MDKVSDNSMASEGYHSDKESSPSTDNHNLSSDLNDIIQRLDVNPNGDVKITPNTTRSNSSRGSASSQNDNEANIQKEAGMGENSSVPESPSSVESSSIWREDTSESQVKNKTKSRKSTSGSIGIRSSDKDGTNVKKSFKSLMRKFSSKGKKKSIDNDDISEDSETHSKTPQKDPYSHVTIESLPQIFITKYLGFRPCKGVYGMEYTRQPTEELLEGVGRLKKGEDLALIKMHISEKGVYLSPHINNKGKYEGLATGLLPIEFISYGVQDVKYSRIFSYIVVKTLSSKSKTMECHAFLCESSIAARKLTLSMALAFTEYSKTLNGKPHKFQVDLQTPKKDNDDAEDVEKDNEHEREAVEFDV